MADAARFPHLALPFAITGAAAGWLSAGLVQQPIGYDMDVGLRLWGAGLAALAGLVTGLLIRRWAVGPRYDWQVDAPDPGARPRSDSWSRHVLTIVAAGVLVGGALALLCDPLHIVLEAPLAALGGGLCAVPFVPVLAAVLHFARRAQRARMGSLVAGSDRRAVWGVLAATLLLASLEGLLDNCLHDVTALEGSGVVWALVAACSALVALVFAADLAAFRRARRALLPGLSLRESASLATEDDAVARLDLGIGDDVQARVRHDGAPYRTRERLLGLVTGDARLALSALRGALLRGAGSLAVVGVVVAAHVAAGSEGAVLAYQKIRCANGHGTECADVAQMELGAPLRSLPDDAVLFFERGCDRGDAQSCMSLADLYRGGGRGRPSRDVALATLFEYRAAQQGLCPDGTRLVSGIEKVCVTPDDPRYR